jgi:hypothetical protein
MPLEARRRVEPFGIGVGKRDEGDKANGEASRTVVECVERKARFFGEIFPRDLKIQGFGGVEVAGGTDDFALAKELTAAAVEKEIEARAMDAASRPVELEAEDGGVAAFQCRFE